MRLARTLWAFLVRDFRVEASYRLSFLLQFGGLFISATFWYFLSGVFDESARVAPYLGGLSFFQYFLGGLMVSRFMAVSMESYANQIRLEQTTGTLEAMLVTPAPLRHLVLASSAWSYLFAGVHALLYLVIGVVVFRVQLDVGSLVGALASVVLITLSFSGIGILSAAFVLYFKRGNPINFLVGNLAALFGGVFIPPESLPRSLGWLADVIPIYYAAESVRGALFRGESLADLAPRLAMLALFAAVLLPIGLGGARYAIRRAKLEGSLVQY